MRDMDSEPGVAYVPISLVYATRDQQRETRRSQTRETVNAWVEPQGSRNLELNLQSQGEEVCSLDSILILSFTFVLGQ